MDTTRTLSPRDHTALRSAALRGAISGVYCDFEDEIQLPGGVYQTRWVAESATIPDHTYRVVLTHHPDGRLDADCECVGWAHRRVCHHVARAVEATEWGPFGVDDDAAWESHTADSELDDAMDGSDAPPFIEPPAEREMTLAEMFAEEDEWLGGAA